MNVQLTRETKMNISLMAMFKIFLIQCLLTMLFAVPFHISEADGQTKASVSVQVVSLR